MNGSWTDDEPGLADARRELLRLTRRARARWLLTLVVALLLTGSLVALRARKPRTFAASVVFRVTEGRFDPESAPPTSAKLQDHIWNVSLSGSRLLTVIKEHGLYPTRVGFDPTWAVEGMREDLDVDVARNFFSEARSAEDPARSARLVISYRAEDPQLAHDVVRHVGRLIAEQQTEFRKLSARLGAEQALVASSRIRAQLESERAEQARINMALATASAQDAPMLQMQLRDTLAALPPLETQLAEAQRAALDYDLRTAFEGRDMGLRFELVDPGRPPNVIISRSTELALFGALAFMVLLPFAAIGVGAFDPRIHGDDDILRLGLEPFGHVPRFASNTIAPLADRLPTDQGAT